MLPQVDFRIFGATLGCRGLCALPSNDLQDADSSRATPKLRRQLFNSLFDLVRVLFDQLRFGCEAPTMIQTQCLPLHIYRRPHVLTLQSFRHAPTLFQDFYASAVIHPSDKVNPTFCQRQLGGQTFDFRGAQLPSVDCGAGFSDGQATECRRSIILIPPQKLSSLLLQRTHRGEVVFVEKVAGPQTVDARDLRVALR